MFQMSQVLSFSSVKFNINSADKVGEEMVSVVFVSLCVCFCVCFCLFVCLFVGWLVGSFV